jgi:glycosyltransferase involved in cell wall biosynthesis
VTLTHTYAWPEVRRGGERYLHELASALADAGHRVSVLASAPRPGRAEVLGVPVTYLRRRKVAFPQLGDSSPDVAFAADAAARLALRPPDVWHALGAPDAAAAGALGRLGRTRSVYTMLGIPVRSYYNDRPDFQFQRAAVRWVGGYVCLSAAAAAALAAGWRRRGEVVAGGVDTRRFVPAAVRHPRPALLYSGSLDAPHKNLPLLMAAMDLLLERVPAAELWLSGSGAAEPLLAGASDRVRDATRVLGTGAEDEQAERYGRAWVTVLPSEFEAFGLCLVESLACGTPIVVLRASGGPAEIARPGIGVIADKSAADLAEACHEALDLSQEHGTAEACRAAAAGYDWRQAIVPRLERVYAGP